MNCHDVRADLLDGSLDVGIFYKNVGGIFASLTTHPAGVSPAVLMASPRTRASVAQGIVNGG